MKKFSELNVGDSVFLIEIINSELPKENIIKEYTVKEIEERTSNDVLHYRIKLSNNTIITPSGIFPFHSVQSTTTDDILLNIFAEIYATDKSECIRIAANTLKIKMRRLHSVIKSSREQLDKLGESAFELSVFKECLPIEVITETVMV